MSFYQPAKLPRLMVAPNGARKIKKDHPAVPLTISETVATAKSCYEAGAGAIHLHVRDKEGQHVLDAGLHNLISLSKTWLTPSAPIIFITYIRIA